ncbi:MAG: hypothetical protein AAGI54_09625 [Planctomycetota bacterium]
MSAAPPTNPDLGSTGVEPAPRVNPDPTPWSFRAKVGRTLWHLVGSVVFRLTFHNWYGLRAAILRLFGAKIGRGTKIRPTAHVEVPWMLEVDDEASVGDFAILYCLGPIHIGKRASVSQYAHLCAGTHDYTDPRLPLIRSPINIGEDAWIGADAFVGPGVTVGALTVLGARASIYKDAEPGKVYVGNPARPIKNRVLRASDADRDASS